MFFFGISPLLIGNFSITIQRWQLHDSWEREESHVTSALHQSCAEGFYAAFQGLTECQHTLIPDGCVRPWLELQCAFAHMRG